MGTLTEKQQKQFDELMEKHQDIFAKDSNDLGRTNITQHSIDTGDERPIHQNFYRVDPAKQEIIKKRNGKNERIWSY